MALLQKKTGRISIKVKIVITRYTRVCQIWMRIDKTADQDMSTVLIYAMGTVTC
jgi:glutaminase